MRFEPRLPRDGINISQEHPLKEAAILIAGLTAVFAVLFGLVLVFVDLVVMLVPPSAEARVFSSWSAEGLDLRREGPRVEAVQALLDRLVRHGSDMPYHFRVAILPGDDPNALALPGGLILVTDGLLRAVESENELALVLGHELGHFHHRDHLRRLGRGMVLGVALAVVSSAAKTRLRLADVVGALTARGFSRDDEQRADRFGLALVQAEYGHVAGAWRFFDRLQAAGQGTAGVAAYLSSHPGNRGRIDDLESYAHEHGWPASGPASALDPALSR